ncbi:hypothetical protein HDU67_008676 [Dinochytrium kinnereticum]|nr:hypothetical protein HDU67_008676 [Dinochytrium kinnereticum]
MAFKASVHVETPNKPIIQRAAPLFEIWESEEEAESRVGGIEMPESAGRLLQGYFDGHSKRSSIGRWSFLIRSAVLDRMVSGDSPAILLSKRLLLSARRLALIHLERMFCMANLKLNQKGLFTILTPTAIHFWISPWWANPFLTSDITLDTFKVSLTHQTPDLTIPLPTHHIPTFLNETLLPSVQPPPGTLHDDLTTTITARYNKNAAGILAAPPVPTTITARHNKNAAGILAAPSVQSTDSAWQDSLRDLEVRVLAEVREEVGREVERGVRRMRGVLEERVVGVYRFIVRSFKAFSEEES